MFFFSQNNVHEKCQPQEKHSTDENYNPYEHRKMLHATTYDSYYSTKPFDVTFSITRSRAFKDVRYFAL